MKLELLDLIDLVVAHIRMGGWPPGSGFPRGCPDWGDMGVTDKWFSEVRHPIRDQADELIREAQS